MRNKHQLELANLFDAKFCENQTGWSLLAGRRHRRFVNGQVFRTVLYADQRRVGDKTIHFNCTAEVQLIPTIEGAELQVDQSKICVPVWKGRRHLKTCHIDDVSDCFANSAESLYVYANINGKALRGSFASALAAFDEALEALNDTVSEQEAPTYGLTLPDGTYGQFTRDGLKAVVAQL